MSRRSEYLSAAVWAAFGLVVVIASWRIDRLENLSINPWSVPGLTPGVVGVLMILLAIALALQARRQAPDEVPEVAAIPVMPEGLADSPDTVGAGAPGSMGRTVLAGALCVLFAGVSLGHGLPFMIEGAVFLFIFITVFSWSQWRAEEGVARGLLLTLVISVAAAALISWLFESVFLVRLP